MIARSILTGLPTSLLAIRLTPPGLPFRANHRRA
jgi:hypothetical protein